MVIINRRAEWKEKQKVEREMTEEIKLIRKV
jgi:hypothetical protein